MTEELWQQLGHTEQLAYHAWRPTTRPSASSRRLRSPCRSTVRSRPASRCPAAIENADAIAAAKAEPAVAEAIAGKTIAKEIYVKGKLVNIAVKG